MIAVIAVKIPEEMVKHIDKTFPSDSANQLRQVAYDYVYPENFFLATNDAIVKVFDGIDNSIEVTIHPQ